MKTLTKAKFFALSQKSAFNLSILKSFLLTVKKIESNPIYKCPQKKRKNKVFK